MISAGFFECYEFYSDDEDLIATLGGNGAISIFLEKIASRIILQNDIHYRQAILNILTKNNLVFYLWQENSGFGGGDISSYADKLNDIHQNMYSVNKLGK